MMLQGVARGMGVGGGCFGISWCCEVVFVLCFHFVLGLGTTPDMNSFGNRHPSLFTLLLLLSSKGAWRDQHSPLRKSPPFPHFTQIPDFISMSIGLAYDYVSEGFTNACRRLCENDASLIALRFEKSYFGC